MGKRRDAQDLDIHVPGDKRGWEVPPELSILVGCKQVFCFFTFFIVAYGGKKK